MHLCVHVCMYECMCIVYMYCMHVCTACSLYTHRTMQRQYWCVLESYYIPKHDLLLVSTFPSAVQQGPGWKGDSDWQLQLPSPLNWHTDWNWNGAMLWSKLTQRSAVARRKTHEYNTRKMYVYMRIHHTHPHTHTHALTCVHTRTHTRASTHPLTYTVHMHTHARAHTHTHTHTHTHIHTHTHTRTHAHTHVENHPIVSV